ncbi:uncharacterized protein LOC110117253 [Athalia rosae]|uniref:uncharacterized protein LOC110117253 n=1 Tax=Athalia rosae TaxID=37344 RepID=UPI0020346376|nr:uncharacterized protein LOC110117253 [Athalia rosae]
MDEKDIHVTTIVFRLREYKSKLLPYVLFFFFRDIDRATEITPAVHRTTRFEKCRSGSITDVLGSSTRARTSMIDNNGGVTSNCVVRSSAVYQPSIPPIKLSLFPTTSITPLFLAKRMVDDSWGNVVDRTAEKRASISGRRFIRRRSENGEFTAMFGWRSFDSVDFQVLKRFVRMFTPGKPFHRAGCLVINVEIVAEGDWYLVEMTHCGGWSRRGVESLFREFHLCMKNRPLSDNKVTTHAHVWTRCNGEGNEIFYDVRGASDFVKRKTKLTGGFVHFPSFRNYVLIKLQYKLRAPHLTEFKDILICEFLSMKDTHPCVKVTFHLEKEIFHTNRVPSDEDFENCQSLYGPLVAIIKQSMNNQFKERCLETLKVDNAFEAQKVLGRTLFSMTHDNYMIP